MVIENLTKIKKLRAFAFVVETGFTRFVVYERTRNENLKKNARQSVPRGPRHPAPLPAKRGKDGDLLCALLTYGKPARIVARAGAGANAPAGFRGRRKARVISGSGPASRDALGSTGSGRAPGSRISRTSGSSSVK